MCLFEKHQEASTHSVRYLVSAESGLKLAAAVSLDRLLLFHASFSQLQEVSYRFHYDDHLGKFLDNNKAELLLKIKDIVSFSTILYKKVHMRERSTD